MTKSNDLVLDFYKKLPFNIRDNLEIYQHSSVNFYHPHTMKLANLFKNVYDIGCGPGHLINNINYERKSKFNLFNIFSKIKCTGIDFNKTAIDYAKQYALKHNLDTNFFVKDVFQLKPGDFITGNKKLFAMSNGALHHTVNCLNAIECCLKNITETNTEVYFLIGLYHLYGRKPFLDKFESLKEKGATESSLRNEFNILRGNTGDKSNDESWFQDQVNHPRETQHTLKEILPVFQDYQFKLVNSSLDKFNHSSPSELIENEKNYLNIGIKALEEKRYFPGYFTCLFRFKKYDI
jgi:SAM-dependent methyltransferase